MTDSEYWKAHFSQQHAANSAHSQRLDFSNDRVQFQTYAWLLEAIGPVNGHSCLDVGCGTGELALMLTALGGKVTAFDIAPPAIEDLARRHPDVCWRVADLAHLDQAPLEPTYDLAVASEVLQYVDAADAIGSIWSKVAPGGRLATVIPNTECPIVQRAHTRFGGRYNGLSVSRMLETVAALPDVQTMRWRAASFLEDQSLFPYGLSPWYAQSVAFPSPPNRLQFVALRAK